MTDTAVERLLHAQGRLSNKNPPTGFKRFSDEVRELRGRLNLTQEQFAARYNIPIGNLRNWEQQTRASSPDTASRVLISIIAVDPDKVAQLIQSARQTDDQQQHHQGQRHKADA